MNMHRVRIWTALVAAAAMAAGCASRADRVSDDQIALQDIDAVPTTPHGKLGYRLDWQGFPAVSGGPLIFESLGDALAVVDSRNTLTIMDASTGRNRWSASVGHRLERIVGVARFNDSVAVCAETSCQVFDLKTGKLLSRNSLASLANTPPLVVQDVAIMGCSNGEVLGHSLSTGYKAWGYMLGGVITARPVHISGNDVGVVSQAGDVIVIDASSGSARGRHASIFGGLANDPVASDRRMFVASLDQSIYAFDGSTGQRAWRVRTESRIRSQPVHADGRVYIALEREGLVCLDAATGERVWSNPETKGTAIGVRKGALLVRDGDLIHRLRPDTGASIESVRFPGVAMLLVPEFSDGPVYTISPRGLVQKFVPEF